MKKKFLSIFIVTFMLFAMIPFSASADTGPKPSTRIQINGLTGDYYVTLLSYHTTNGPHSVYNEDLDYDNRYLKNEDDYDIWKTFVDYEDPDGYHFLQVFSKLSGTDEYAWTYYPPDKFKVLIYIPETGKFISSEIRERYAFDSYYVFDVEANSITENSNSEPLPLEKNYNYTWELISLCARIVLTIAIEIGLALLFGYRLKKQLLLIGAVNIVTQIALNIALNVQNFYHGELAFTLLYIFLEFCVFAIEAVIYFAALDSFGNKPPKRFKAVIYALASNACSFALGLGLSYLIPGIF